MAKWRYVAGDPDGDTIINGATENAMLFGNLEFSPTEARTVYILRDSYTFDELYCRVTANTTTAATTVTLRDTGVDTSLQISIGAAATGVFEDLTNSASLVDTDDVGYQISLGGMHGEEITFVMIGVTADNSNGKSTIGGSNPTSPPTVPQGVTGFFSLGGIGFRETTENNCRYLIRSSYTFEDMEVFIATNTVDNASTVTFRDSFVDTSLLVSIPSGSTGLFVDLTNTASVVAADTLTIEVAAGAGMAGDSLAIAHWVFHSTATDDRRITAGMFSGFSSPREQDFGLTEFTPVEGDLSPNTTENNSKILAKVLNDVVNYQTQNFFNILNGVTSSFLRVNGADSILGVSITASTTGIFEDTTDVVALAAADEINFSMDTSAATTGIIRWGSIGMEQKPPDEMPWHFNQPEGIHRIVEVLAY